jgi:broad specificity phosphatase PhoE
MGTLYLVRHGQASFGAENYDQLSALGERQCAALGAWLHARELRFDAVLRGTLVRHAQSLDGIATTLPGLPAALEWPGLNEYDGYALVKAVHGGVLPVVSDAQGYRQHFRLLREGMTQWMAGAKRPEGMPSWAEFVAGVAGALDHVRSNFEGNVLVVSSGGPIATAVAHVLAAPPSTVIELNMRIRNSALTEFAFTPKRHMLVTYNTVPHLDHPDRLGWVTYA